MHRNSLLCFLAAIFLSGPLLAQDENSHPSKELKNLIYYPHVGHFVLAGQSIMTLQDLSQVTDVNGNETTTSVTQSEQLTATANFGLAPQWRLSVAESWMALNSTSATKLSNDTVTTTQTLGAYNPTLSTSYRYHEAERDGLHADVTASLTPSIGQKLAAVSNQQTGTEYGGAWSASLSLPFYWFYGIQEVELSPAATRSFGGTSQGTTPSNSTQTSPYWTESITLADRLHLTSRHFLQPTVSYNFQYSYSTTSQKANATSTGHSVPGYFVPSLTYGYTPSETTLWIVGLNYTQTKNDASPANGNNTETQVSNFDLTLQARFEF